MNVITYACGHLLYSDGTTVVSKLNKCFKFGDVISVESNLCIDRSGQMWEDAWEGGKLTLVNYHLEVKNFKYRDMQLREMPPLSRALIEKLSLDRCHLYNMHRNERLTFRELDKEIMDCFQYWNYILDRYGIGLFICHGFPHSIYTYSLYAICKAKDIKVFYIARSCVPGYIYCSDDLYENFKKLETAYKDALAQTEPLVLSDFMKSAYVDYMEKDSYRWAKIYKEPGRGKIPPVPLGKKIAAVFNYKLWGRCARKIREKIDQKIIPKKTIRYFKKLSVKADYNARFIYVPLQMQPESTTSPMGNIFVDFLMMVKILAYCVKDTDIMLYVKEHGAQARAVRPSRRKLYDDLRELPNVKLINIEENTFKLQEHCIASATCSGTVVMESMFKYKPVLVFGNRLHNLAPSSYVVSSAESCSAALDDILSGRFKIGRKERDAFLYAIERACVRGFWFVKYSPQFGISQDEAAENVYMELKAGIEELV